MPYSEFIANTSKLCNLAIDLFSKSLKTLSIIGDFKNKMPCNALFCCFDVNKRLFPAVETVKYKQSIKCVLYDISVSIQF